MNIYILEDDINQQGKMERIVQQLTTKNQIPYDNLFTTSQPKTLLENIDAICQSSIYFLATKVQGHEKRGLEIAQQIRKTDIYGHIVFLANHREMVTEIFHYKVSALDFIEKDQNKKDFIRRIEECLHFAHEEKKKISVTDTFVFQNQHTSFRIPFSDILFFETAEIPHKIRMVTKRRSEEFYGSLTEIMEGDERFFQCHRSYLVNMESVGNIGGFNKKMGVITYPNGERCQVSRANRNTLFKRLQGIE